MRLIRLVSDDFALDFHPFITVVRGLGDAERESVVDAIGALPRGHRAGMEGLVEAHGVVLDLTPETLALLELADGEVAPIVSSDDLPGRGETEAQRNLAVQHNAAEEALAQVAAAHAEVARLRTRLDDATTEQVRAASALDEVDAMQSEHDTSLGDVTATQTTMVDAVEAARAVLTDAETAHATALEALTDVESSTTEVRRLRDEAAAEAMALAGQLESAEGALDAGADDDVRAAERARTAVVEAAEAERRAEAESDGGEVIDVEPPEQRLARLEVRRAELDAELAVLGGAETAAVEAAVEAVRGESGDEISHVSSPDALELADQIEDAEASLRRIGASGDIDTSATVAARARLDEARRALAEAEQQVRGPQLDRSDIDELELAHADVLDAQDKVDGRFSGGRSGRRLEEAREAERGVLDRLGFDSYADYMMGTSMLHVDDAQEAALDAARAELADAEDAWSELQAGVDVELEQASLIDQLRVFRDRASVILGEPVADDAVARLRAHRIVSERGGDETSHLAGALQSAGLAVAHEDLDAADLLSMAEEWLVEERIADERREVVLAERYETDLELAETRSQLSQAAAGMSGPSSEDRRKARIDDATATLDAARERLRRHTETSQEVDELRAALAATSQRVDEAESEAAGADASLEAAADTVQEAEAVRAAAFDDLQAAEQALQVTADRQTDAAAAGLSARRSAAVAALETADERLAMAREAFDKAEQNVEAAEVSQFDTAAALATAQRLVDDEGDVDAETSIDELEWYLLSRLAAQRRLSYAGSVPMVIDRALDHLSTDDVSHLLDRLERMAAAVQLVVISEDSAPAEWATNAGEARGAVVDPVVPSELVPFV